MFRRLCLCLALGLAAQPATGQVTLPPAVERELALLKISSGGVAAVVQEVAASRPVLSVNPAIPMNPASVMKLVTTYAALEQLGPTYRWKTEAYVDGTVREEVLQGDLFLRGGGDPKLDLEGMGRLVRALRGKGLREIRGDLVIDRTRFAREGGDAARFDGDPFRPYNVLPDALLVNYKSLRFVFVAEPERGAVRLYAEPRPPSLEIVNALKLSNGPCLEGSAFREQLKATYEPGRRRAVFAGSFPASCGEKDLNVALLDSNEQVAGVFRQLWSESGGSWQGGVREGPVPPAARLAHALDSPPLAEIVRDTNKFSNNIMARHLYLTLGAEAAGAPADTAKSFAAVKAWLAAKKIAAPELVMENGSGLSRVERIAAGNLAELLQAAWRSAVMPEFVASLPIAGADGTMRRRLKGDGVSGQAHVKTGLLNDVRAMAGYVLARSGRRYVVVMIVNHPRAPEAQGAMDALLRWTYEH